MSIVPTGTWTETLHSQLGIRARTNDESQLGIRPLFSHNYGQSTDMQPLVMFLPSTFAGWEGGQKIVLVVT